MTHPILKNFVKGDIVTWENDENWNTRMYGKECLMEVQHYDKEGWCRIKYINPIRPSDKGQPNGHPDSILKLVKRSNILPEELFTI